MSVTHHSKSIFLRRHSGYTSAPVTTMALVARRWNLMEPLRAFAQSGRPVWGTCAGLIFLAGAAINVKQGGQELVGGLDVEVARNFFGAQINSFETHLPAPAAIRGIKDAMPADQPADTFRAVFIRAPAVTKVGPDVDVLAEYSLTADERAEDASRPEKVIVAVRQGSLMATAFHPEVTNDGRWHAMFADMVSASCAKLGRAALKAKALSNGVELVKPKDVPKPLPVIE